MIVCFVSNLGRRHRLKNANSMTHRDQQSSCIQTIEDRNESFSVRILNKFKLTHTEIVNLLNYPSGKSSTGEHKKNNDKRKTITYSRNRQLLFMCSSNHKYRRTR